MRAGWVQAMAMNETSLSTHFLSVGFQEHATITQVAATRARGPSTSQTSQRIGAAGTTTHDDQSLQLAFVLSCDS